jgi:hypothetical protein
VYEIGDSYEKFRAKAMIRLGKLLDKAMLDSYNDAKNYEEAIYKRGKASLPKSKNDDA